MDISYIYEFLTLVETGRFSDAADLLFTTSSSLSKHIRALEEEYGVPLFDRSKRAVTLNEYGQSFLIYARQITQLDREARKELNKKKTRRQNSLSIGAEYRIFELAIDFRRKYQMSLNINEESHAEELLRKGICELAFVVNLEDAQQEFHTIPFQTDELVFVCPKTHPLAGKEVVEFASLKDEDFVMFPDPEHNKIAGIIDNGCRNAGFRPNIVFNGTLGTNVVNSVAQGMGTSLLWVKALQSIMREEITYVRLQPTVEIQISLCYLKGKVLSENARIFVNYMKERQFEED